MPDDVTSATLIGLYELYHTFTYDLLLEHVGYLDTRNKLSRSIISNVIA